MDFVSKILYSHQTLIGAQRLSWRQRPSDGTRVPHPLAKSWWREKSGRYNRKAPLQMRVLGHVIDKEEMRTHTGGVHWKLWERYNERKHSLLDNEGLFWK